MESIYRPVDRSQQGISVRCCGCRDRDPRATVRKEVELVGVACTVSSGILTGISGSSPSTGKHRAFRLLLLFLKTWREGSAETLHKLDSALP